MSRERRLRPDERRLWGHIAKSVTPLPGRTAEATEPAPVDAPPKKKTAAGKAAHPGPKPAHHVASPTPKPHAARPPSPPAERSAERRVRRGRLDPEARLDLHGFTQAQAQAALAHFLTQAQVEGMRCVLVITGKGLRGAAEHATKAFDLFDQGPGVLRKRFPAWLSGPDVRPRVSGYAPAHAKHGGGGAWYVFLKKREDSPRVRI